MIESDIVMSMYSLSLLSVTVTVILLWRKFCDWSMNDVPFMAVACILIIIVVLAHTM